MNGIWGFVLLGLLAHALGEVAVLTKKNFDDVVNQNELVLVEFYAPWCGHCKRLEPEYNKASEELEGLGPLLAKVDVTQEKELGERFHIEGFPTLKVFRSGHPSAYEGGRTAKDIVAYMKKQTGPAIKPLDSVDDLNDFIPDAENEDPVVVAFAEANSEVANFITEYAKKFRDDFTFGLVTAASVAGDNAMGSLVLFKPFDELQNVYSGELSEDAFSSFLKAVSMKAVDEIGPENYAGYVKRGLPISWLFIDPDAEETSDALEEYRKVAAEFKDRLSFVYLDGVKYKQMATKMGLSEGASLPGLSIDTKGEHFVYPEGDDLVETSLKEWYTKYVGGQLAPHVKSEPIPSSLFDENNVATIVGDNFKDVVLDDSKDVLIEFYAPWCGHCKSLVQTWNQLGQTFKGVDSVVIAKSDATTNDYPSGFQVSGFPTIQLVTSKGNKVINFSGDRKLESFISWLKANAATPIEMPQPGGDATDLDDEL